MADHDDTSSRRTPNLLSRRVMLLASGSALITSAATSPGKADTPAPSIPTQLAAAATQMSNQIDDANSRAYFAASQAWLNAVQAVPKGGEISFRAGKDDGGEVFMEIADNGPGVAPENRSEIFKPYFTTTQNGTGLGLAVVQQIVLAHGWEIQCRGNEPTGAVFRITHVKPVSRS